jgi:hypothetical protein
LGALARSTRLLLRLERVDPRTSRGQLFQVTRIPAGKTGGALGGAAAWCCCDGDHPLDNRRFYNPEHNAPSKAAMVRSMLSGDDGATLAEIMHLTGWKACTCRAFLTGVRTHRRYKLLRSKVTGVSRYHLELLR